MTIEAKALYLKKISLRYKNATKKQKGKLLSEAAEICDYSRKHLIRLLNRSGGPKPQKRGRKPKYTISDTFHLVKLWKLMRYMCSKRMRAALPLWLKYYECPEDVKKHLQDMSSSTIDRHLFSHRREWKKGLSATKSGSFIKSRIPIELLHSKVTTPGFVEGDLVVHCGNTLLGDYANTLTVTDLFSGWTQNRASWGKSSEVVLDNIKLIRQAMPFSLKGFACDNGTEFINYKLLKYFECKKSGKIKFVRRRPYKKNDNAHVEQKNDTHVRQLFGYSRVDSFDLISLMNDIYQNYWNPFNNFFCPAMKLKKKIRIGSKIKKIYDQPKTPYERLLGSGCLTDLQEKNLITTFESLNPITLKKAIDQKIKIFNSKLTKEQKMGGGLKIEESA